MKNHLIYSALLSQLTLDQSHKDNLLSRGFSSDLIEILQYKTFPHERIQIADKLAQKFDLTGVPGFWKNNQNIWQLAGSYGIVIPVRDFENNMVALKIRTNNNSAKYLYLSSNPKKDKQTGQINYPYGTAAQVSVHYPFQKPGDLSIIRITEGELKADLINFLSGIYTLSVPGVNLWARIIDEIKALKPKKVLISFDADKNKKISSSTQNDSKPYAVAKAIANLYLSIKNLNIEVAIEDWPEEKGKGIDDVFSAGFNDYVKELNKEDTEKFIAETLNNEFPFEWCYILATKCFVNKITMQELDKEQFDDKFLTQCKSMAKKSLSNPAFIVCDKPIYFPTEQQFINKDGMKYFNFWKQSNVIKREGNCDIFIDHIKYITNNELEFNLVMDYLAYNVQFPGKKMHWALLIQGNYGIGKSLIGHAMRLILGEDNVASPTNKELHSDFNGWQKRCSFVIIEEVMASGRLDFMNILKPLITENRTRVNEKMKNAYEQPCKFNFLMYTNPKNSLIIDQHDRRYAIVYSKAIPKSKQHFKKLADWIEENPDIIAYELHRRDLTAFMPFGEPPLTEGKKELVRESMQAAERWLHELIEDEIYPLNLEIITLQQIMNLQEFDSFKINSRILGKFLSKLGAEQKRIRINNKMMRVWIISNIEQWSVASAKKIEEYLQHQNISCDNLIRMKF